jgi:hypothetical protein
MAPPRTYQFTVEGVGKFVFRRRVMADRYLIVNRGLALMGGDVINDGLVQAATQMAELMELQVEGPEGWDVTEMDPLDAEHCELFDRVHKRFREAEETFRAEFAAKRASMGKASQPNL